MENNEGAQYPKGRYACLRSCDLFVRRQEKCGNTMRETMKTEARIDIIGVLVVFALLMSSATAQTTPSGEVSKWAAEGDSSDSLGTNDGTLHGGITFSIGKVGQGFVLNGTSGYVDVPDSPSLDLQSNATLMAWICLEERPSHAGHIMHIMGKSQFGNDLDLQVETDDRVRLYAVVSPVAVAASSSILQTGVGTTLSVRIK